MRLRLTRNDFRTDGIFGVLSDEAGAKIAVTLEHSYDCKPKIPAGSYTCVRGKHRLHGMTEDFETFEITGVSGHSNLLFHWGNWNSDSEGCVLVGKSIAQSDKCQMITSSRSTFERLLTLWDGLDSFILDVEDLGGQKC